MQHVMPTNEDHPLMKSPPNFQIKVALIGNVSAGKTTVVNALFRDKYGEVSMKRTTAGVNEFAVSGHEEWGVVSDEPRDSHSILKEITQDNIELRASDEVKTKRFEIELEFAICEMRKDTQLILVDIPGINEANVSSKYKTYVENNWRTFDCVVVVMDGRQGVNTECQVSLLHFVKSNLESKKNLPVIILCNKIDDQDDEEQEELVLEAQREVEKIFGVSDRQESLRDVLQTCGSAKQEPLSDLKSNNECPWCFDQVSPVFIPISGITAFIFQTCTSMSLDRFRQFDEKLIAKLGRERIGKFRWKKLSEEERIEEAHKAVSDPEGYQEGVADSNFDKFLKVLSFLVGGKTAQEMLIKNQITGSLRTMSSKPGMVEKLEIVYKNVILLSLENSEANRLISAIKSTFWLLYEVMAYEVMGQNNFTKKQSSSPRSANGPSTPLFGATTASTGDVSTKATASTGSAAFNFRSTKASTLFSATSATGEDEVPKEAKKAADSSGSAIGSGGFSFGGSSSSGGIVSGGFTFGAQFPAAAATTAANSGVGFTFGAPAPVTGDSKTASRFTFGASALATGDSKTTSGIAFGTPATATGDSKTTSGFTFGESAPATRDSKTTSGFVFGTPAPATGNWKTTSGFTFATSPPATGDSKTTSGFIFGAPAPAESIGFTFGTPKTDAEKPVATPEKESPLTISTTPDVALSAAVLDTTGVQKTTQPGSKRPATSISFAQMSTKTPALFGATTASADLNSFRPLADELKSYRAFALRVGWKSEADESVEVFKNAVQMFLVQMDNTPGFVEELKGVYSVMRDFSVTEAEEASVLLAAIKSTFSRLCTKPKEHSTTALNSFHSFADDLKNYRDFALTVGWNSEADRSVDYFKLSVRKYLAKMRFQEIDGTVRLAEQLKVVYYAMKEFSLVETEDSLEVKNLSKTFEDIFQRLASHVFGKFDSADSVPQLSLLADELIAYHSLATEAGWAKERLEVGAKFKNLVMKQIGTLWGLTSKCSNRGFGIHKSSPSASFADLSWFEWRLILRSILVLRYDCQFCLDFSREMVLIECMLESNPSCEAREHVQCPNCAHSLDFNRFCTRCKHPVTSKILCLRNNCPGTSVTWLNEKTKLYRCNHPSCGRTHFSQKSEIPKEGTLKHFCPNCSNQELNYNRRCCKCQVFFRPAPAGAEHKTDSPTTCPWDQCGLGESGECTHCGNVWKYFPNQAHFDLKYDGYRLQLLGKSQEKAIDVPSSFSDPNHFGHLAWKYCEFMAATSGHSG